MAGQEQLAHLTGRERRFVHRLEAAEFDVSLSPLIQLADHLDIPLALLVDNSLEIDLTATHRNERPERPS